ncbi:MAG: hypothetical protein H6602_07475 [Flavobacteriales bacterium]|nr:hypothetical protein [Flavobacteriales bacterium]MCB9191488.1 hypothetical protein [Flavobacteriales bacterium]
MTESLDAHESDEIDDLISIGTDEESTEEIPVIERDKKVQWLELAGSSFLFASAYLLLYILYDFVTALAAAHFGLEPVLFYDTIRFENNDGWYPHCVKRVFVVGAIAMGFLGAFFYILYLILRKSYIFVRLFMLWGSLISFAILAQRMMSVPFAGNFEYRRLDSLGMELAIFTSYMYYKPSTEWAIGFLGFLLIIGIGILYAKPFLQTAWSSKQIGSEKERLKFLRYQVLLPVVFGALAVTAVVWDTNAIPNMISYVATLICLLVMIVHAMLMGSFKIPRQKTWERWPIVPTIVFILVIVAIKTVLTTGIVIPNPEIYRILEVTPSDL